MPQHYVVSREEVNSVESLDRIKLYDAFFKRGSKFSPSIVPFSDIDFKTHQQVTFYNFLRTATRIYGSFNENKSLFYPVCFNHSPVINDGMSVDDCIVLSAQAFILDLIDSPKQTRFVHEYVKHTDLITLGCAIFNKNQLSIVTSIIVEEEFAEDISEFFIPKADWLDVSLVAETVKDTWFYDFIK